MKKERDRKQPARPGQNVRKPSRETDTLLGRFLNLASAIAVAYGVLGALWILLSDQLVNLLAPSPQEAARWQTIKGWGYVAATTVLLYAVLQIYVTRRRRAETALRKRTAQLEALQEISLAVTAQLDVGELLETVVAHARRLLDVQGASLYLADPVTGELEQVVSRGYARDHTGSRLAPGEGIAGRVLETGEPFYVDEYGRWEGRASGWEDEEITGSLAVPFQRGGRVIGTLGFDAIGAPRRFGERDVRLASMFGHQAAIAIENARLYEEIVQRASDLGILYEVTAAAATGVHLDQVLERALDALVQSLEPDAIAILLVEEETDELLIRASAGFSGGPKLVRRSVGVGIPGQVVETGQPILLPDVRQHPGYHACDPETRSEICVPLKLGDHVIGALNLESHRVAAFDQDNLRLLSIVAGSLATVIENARLYEQTRQEIAERKRAEEQLRDRERFLALLNEVTRGCLATSDLPTTLQLLADRLGDLFEADGCYLTLWDDGAQLARPVAAYGQWRDSYSSLTVDPDQPTLTSSVLRHGRPLAVENVNDTPYVHPSIADQFPDRSILALPLVAGDEKLGAALVAFAEPQVFDQQAIDRAELVARQIALAVARAESVAQLRRYADELEARVDERTEQVREQFAQMAAILDSVDDGIVLAEAGGDIVLANPVAENWLHHVLSPEEAGQLRQRIRALAGRPARHPAELLELTGLDLQLRAASIGNGDGDSDRAVVTIHDVTHLRAMDRMKTRFIDNISHELKTPVATIKILAHLMGKQPENWRQHWELLTEETEHLADLIQGIVDIARLDAGRLEMTFQATSLNRMTERVVGSYQDLARERGLTLSFRPSPGDPVVEVDRRYLMDGLKNLVENAIHYTPEDGQVTVSVREVDRCPAESWARGPVKGGDGASGEAQPLVPAQEGPPARPGERRWVTVTVTDTGWGIPEEEQERIFDRFFRGDRPRAMQVSGTGLGLSLARQIVALHGGVITLESQVDEGSAFTVWLPMTRGSAVEPRPKSSSPDEA